MFSGDESQYIKISHEVSHAWFGIIIGSQDWTEAWISEGFATFLEEFIHDKVLLMKKEKCHKDLKVLRCCLKYESLLEEVSNTRDDLQMLQPMEGKWKEVCKKECYPYLSKILIEIMQEIL